jgi:hypothetical protein
MRAILKRTFQIGSGEVRAAQVDADAINAAQVSTGEVTPLEHLQRPEAQDPRQPLTVDAAHERRQPFLSQHPHQRRDPHQALLIDDQLGDPVDEAVDRLGQGEAALLTGEPLVDHHLPQGDRQDLQRHQQRQGQWSSRPTRVVTLAISNWSETDWIEAAQATAGLKGEIRERVSRGGQPIPGAGGCLSGPFSMSEMGLGQRTGLEEEPCRQDHVGSQQQGPLQPVRAAVEDY